MTEVSLDELRRHVEWLHGCSARFRELAPVHEQFEGQTVWEGTVHVFDVKGLADASTAYAWSSSIEDSDRRQFYAVLAVPPIGSASAAVRASIVQDHIEDRKGSNDPSDSERRGLTARAGLVTTQEFAAAQAKLLRAKLLEEFPDRDSVWVELSEDYEQIEFRVDGCTGKVGAGTALEPEKIEEIISGLRDLLG